MKKTTTTDWQASLIMAIERDPYLYWHQQLRIISVFDDVRYDRSDLDLLSPAMRQHIVKQLKQLGCKQARGQQLISPNGNVLWMPKPSVLGSSTFDIGKYTKRAEHDIYILTPTQAAAYWLDNGELEPAVEAIANMIKQQPCNLRKIEDHIGSNPKRKAYIQAMPYLRKVLRESQEQPEMKFKRSLGSVF